MRHVKDLCYEQLRAMSDDQITQAIGNPGTSSSKELPSHSKGDDVMEKDQESEEDSSGRECGKPKDKHANAEIVINISDVSEESEVEERSGVNERSEVIPRDTRGRGEVGMNERHTPASYNPPTTHSQRQQVFRRDRQDLPATEQGWSESTERHAPGHSQGNHSSLRRGSEGDGKERQSRHKPPDDGGPQAGNDKLLEMDLRRRALEAELRRTNADRASSNRPTTQWEREESKGAMAPIKVEEGSGRGETECEDVIMVHPECEEEEEEERGSETGTGQGSGDVLRVGELLEERLRERALQAMLSKKGQPTTKRNSTS